MVGATSNWQIGGALLALALAVGATEVRAGDAPDAEAVRRAAAQFDEGARAYRQNHFEQAAPHFEAAFEAVPSARALRMSIKARARAGQKARAATLAALAKQRYPDDEKTLALANETIEGAEDDLHRLDVTCSSACVLAAGSRSVAGTARKSWVLYLKPGRVTVSASFVDGSGGDRQVISTRAGGDNSLRFQPGVKPAAASAPSGEPADAAGDHAADPVGDPPAPDAPADGGGQPRGNEPDDSESSSWINSPGVFVGALVATAAVGAVTAWSGVDTINNPGADAVREACAGKGTDCPEYREGLDKQLRTNVLIGATAGVGALTIIIAIFVTDWGGGDDEANDDARSEGPRLTAAACPDGAALQLGGRF